MRMFNIGDRVTFTRDNENDINVKKGDKGTIIGISESSYCVEFDRYVNGHDGFSRSFKGKDGHCWWFSFAEINKQCAKDTQKLVVTVKGTETLAQLYEGDKVIKSATAKCSPADKFDFETGAKIAVERIFGKTEQADKKLKIKVGKSYWLKPYDEVEYHYSITKDIWEEIENTPVKILEETSTRAFKGKASVGTWYFLPEHFAKEAPQYYNGKVVCVSKQDSCYAYTVGKIYEFKDGRVRIDNGSIIPSDRNYAVTSVEDWNSREYFNAKFIPLVE